MAVHDLGSFTCYVAPFYAPCMKRVAVAALMHESNTFNPTPTRRTDFSVADGSQLYEQDYRHGDSSTWGILQTLLSTDGFEPVPLYFARALPGGPVPLEDYLYLRRHIVERLTTAGRIDAVCLALHGSMLVPGEFDPEGRLGFEIRAVVGKKVPIVAAVDMHSKLSPQLEAVLDGLVAYRTAPHVDCYETGARAAGLVVHALSNEIKIALSTARIPLLVAGEKTETDVPPMSHVVGHLEKLEQRGEVLSAGVLLGFPWADTPYAGVTVVTVTGKDGEPSGRHHANTIAKELWTKRRRFDFTTEACLLPEALRRAGLEDSQAVRTHGTGSKPVVISDSGDNPTAGASQTMSFCLQEAVEDFNRSVLISAIADPAAFAEVSTLGAHTRTTLEIGTVTHGDHNPFVWTCTVERIVRTPDCGVAVLSDGRVTCLLTDRRVATGDPSLIFDCSLEPTTYDVLIVKCGYQGPEYKALAGRSIMALTPGDSNEELSQLPFELLPRPIFPLDSGTTWSPPW
jgi:microcystin degradation protein MlrC